MAWSSSIGSRARIEAGSALRRDRLCGRILNGAGQRNGTQLQFLVLGPDVPLSSGPFFRNRMKQSDLDAITTPGMHLIERGLYLQVRGPTARSWVLRSRFAGQQRDLELGSAFDVSLNTRREVIRCLAI